jgi:hypothetical protein
MLCARSVAAPEGRQAGDGSGARVRATSAQGAPAPIVTVPPAQVPTDTPPAATTTAVPSATFAFPGGGNGGRY